MPTVNDIHSQLNCTHVDRILKPTSLDQLRQIVFRAVREDQTLSMCGGRHAMGGQQFGASTCLLDMGRSNRLLNFDPNRGLVEVEAGIEWPLLVQRLLTIQRRADQQWGIAQKQTGADRLSIGGAIAANAHSRGLKMGPIIRDVESFLLVDVRGEVHHCSRTENSELFRLVIGGYGLLGLT